ncbi:hypothetical protein SAMN04515668_2510 [Hymenobacter arizonensis]|uniref:Uncharacterized protein n=1 Tax=Hymenobacter arizonensis TaxID=1227077 RepID=A0A1I5YWS0_HYMAR|nr:hypothetical protein SAMN04515668_2510 [Hymenobacter arizonensis]
MAQLEARYAIEGVVRFLFWSEPQLLLPWSGFNV